MKKITMVINGREYTRNGISAGDYEEFTDLRNLVNPDGDYNREDIENIRKALSIAFSGQISADELKEADVTELIYQFMAVDALIAAGLQEKVEKMKADFGIGE